MSELYMVTIRDTNITPVQITAHSPSSAIDQFNNKNIADVFECNKYGYGATVVAYQIFDNGDMIVRGQYTSMMKIIKKNVEGGE